MDQKKSPNVEQDHIDVNDPKACADWARKLDCSEAQLREAAKGVGNQAGEVEMHPHGLPSTTNSDRVPDADDDS